MIYLPHRRKAWLGSGAAFSPTDIVGCKLWLKSDAGCYSDAGITPCTNGQGVYQWNDQSGNSFHFAQSSSPNRPLWSSTGPAVDFDGAAHYIRSASISIPSGNKTVFFAFYQDDQYVNNCMLSAYTDLKCCLRSPAGTGHIAYYDESYSWKDSSTNSPAGLHTICWNLNSTGTAGNTYLDGSSIDSKAYVASVIGNDSFIGASRVPSLYYNGKIYEVLIYNSALGSADMANVQTYLKGRWGTP